MYLAAPRWRARAGKASSRERYYGTWRELSINESVVRPIAKVIIITEVTWRREKRARMIRHTVRSTPRTRWRERRESRYPRHVRSADVTSPHDNCANWEAHSRELINSPKYTGKGKYFGRFLKYQRSIRRWKLNAVFFKSTFFFKDIFAYVHHKPRNVARP